MLRGEDSPLAARLNAKRRRAFKGAALRFGWERTHFVKCAQAGTRPLDRPSEIVYNLG